jgi:flagellar biosynthesis protein FliQ
MSQALVLDILREGFFTIIKVSLPILLTSLTVGLVVSLLQAITQIQEQTLTFVPKMIAVMLSLVLFGNYMLNQLVSFANQLFRLIGQIG